MSIVPLEEDDTLRQIFTQLDVNGDGQLNLQELTEGLQHAGLSRRTQSLFNVLDVDNQGSVNWNQFQKVGSGFLSVLNKVEKKKIPARTTLTNMTTPTKKKKTLLLSMILI